MTTPNLPPNIQDLSQKAEKTYSSLPASLKTQNEGRYIAIEIESGDHFIGDTKEEAVSQARQKYPETLVFVRRIGSIEKISLHNSSLFNDNSYACLL